LFFVDLCIDDHGSLVIFRPASVDPNISSIKTSTMITSSNSLFRERDAPSHGRCFTSHHVRYRAVPRTKRTLTTVNTHNHSATSSTTESPACVPSLLWQCSCPDASPGAWTGAAGQDESAPLLAPPPPTRSATRSGLVADVPQALLASTGVFTRNHAHIRADLLALTLRFIAHLLSLICPNRARNHTTFESHDTSSNAAISAKQRNFVSPIKNSRLT
jgi:hypothetical protein